MFKGKSKEEDKIEKIIRGLLKLPENRRCINCNSLGPQYVCTTFWTFVCTNCSGVHREFTHRVKSVSMAKFTTEEVGALQAGGNERARQIYFKTWDPVRHGFPESGNINRLRDFLKHVYVAKRFTGGSPSDRLPRLKLSDRDNCYDCRGLEERSSYHGRNVDRSSRFYFSEGKSPHYFRETDSPGNYRRSTSRVEVADNRYKDIDAAVLRRSATQMFTTADIAPGRSPVHSKNRGTSSPPAVRHVREVLGEKFLALHVGEEPRYSGRRADGPAEAEVGDRPQSGDWSNFNASAHAYKAAPSSTKRSGTYGSVKNSSGSSESYVIVRRNASPKNTSSAKQMGQNFVARDGNNLVTSETPANQKASVPKQNTLEFLLFEFSSPVDAPTSDQHGTPSSDNSQVTRPSGNLLDSLPSDKSHASDTVPTNNMPTQPNNYDFLGASSVGTSSMWPNIPATFSNTPAVGQASALTSTDSNIDKHMPVENSNNTVPAMSSHTMVPAPSLSGLPAPSAPAGNPTEKLDCAGAPTSEMASDLLGDDDRSVGPVADMQLSLIPQPEHTTSPGSESSFHLQQINASDQAAINQLARTSLGSNVQGNSTGSLQYSQPVSTDKNESSGDGTQPSAAEIKSSGRKELPADFFTSLYSSNPVPSQGWQTGPQYGMSFNMHYHPAPMQMPVFPNASKSRNPFDLSDETSQARPPMAMFPSMASLHGAMPNVSAPPGISTSNFGSHNSDACMGQHSFSTMQQHQFNNMPPARPLEVAGFGVVGQFGSLDSNQQSSYEFPFTKPNSFPAGGGNPFD